MLRHYLLIATKVLLRRKFFTFISLFGIAFTLSVLVVATALLDHTFAPEPPESRLDRSVGVYSAVMYGAGGRWQSDAGYRLLDQYARDLPGTEQLTIFSVGSPVASYVDGEKVDLYLKRTDAPFWSVFDFTFLDGRPFSQDEVHDAAPVAVITESAAGRLLGGRPWLGATVGADGQRFRVVGVVANVSRARSSAYADMWVPHTTSKDAGYRTQLMGGFEAVALARTPADRRAIRDEFNARLARVELPDRFEGLVAPFETKFESVARELSLGADVRDTSSQAWRLAALMTVLWLLFAALPAVNLVNINISRILERASEIGVRKAFGASSRTLVVQFVVENVLLTLAGAAIAFVLSFAVLEAINASGVIAHATLSLNTRVFLWGVGFALAFGVLSGVYPAWRMSRLQPAEALKGGLR